MSNQNHATTIADIYALAECDMEWMSVTIADLKKRIAKVKEDSGLGGSVFYELERILDMYQYIVENRLSHYSDKVLKHESELEGNKKAVIL